jgi:hypothetical protein
MVMQGNLLKPASVTAKGLFEMKQGATDSISYEMPKIRIDSIYTKFMKMNPRWMHIEMLLTIKSGGQQWNPGLMETLKE